MADVAELAREWTEAKAACQSLITKYATGGFIPRDEPERDLEKEKDWQQEKDRLKRVADEKWEAFWEAYSEALRAG